MLNINFVPEDYIEKRQLYRANTFYLILLVAVLCIFGGTFLVIKVRQRALLGQANLVNSKMVRSSQTIAQLEELESKHKQMMKTALMTAELIEVVPRSLLLAALTNSLPPGVSLTRLKLAQKEVMISSPSNSSKYEAVKRAQSRGGAKNNSQEAQRKTTRTKIEIEGLAPSDIEVAQYISQLGDSILLEDIQLVRSKEHKIDEERFRMFELTAMLKKDVCLSQEDIASLKAKRSSS